MVTIQSLAVIKARELKPTETLSWISRREALVFATQSTAKGWIVTNGCWFDLMYGVLNLAARSFFQNTRGHNIPSIKNIFVDFYPYPALLRYIKSYQHPSWRVGYQRSSYWPRGFTVSTTQMGTSTSTGKFFHKGRAGVASSLSGQTALISLMSAL